MFTNYTYRKDGRIKEVWLTAAAFEKNTLAARQATKNRRQQLMETNPEKLIQESRDNYLKYRETYRRNSKLWRESNREHVNLHRKKRRKEDTLYNSLFISGAALEKQLRVGDGKRVGDLKKFSAALMKSSWSI